jgi:hypothetical protein
MVPFICRWRWYFLSLPRYAETALKARGGRIAAEYVLYAVDYNISRKKFIHHTIGNSNCKI